MSLIGGVTKEGKLGGRLMSDRERRSPYELVDALGDWMADLAMEADTEKRRAQAIRDALAAWRKGAPFEAALEAGKRSFLREN